MKVSTVILALVGLAVTLVIYSVPKQICRGRALTRVTDVDRLVAELSSKRNCIRSQAAKDLWFVGVRNRMRSAT